MKKDLATQIVEVTIHFNCDIFDVSLKDLISYLHAEKKRSVVSSFVRQSDKKEGTPPAEAKPKQKGCNLVMHPLNPSLVKKHSSYVFLDWLTVCIPYSTNELISGGKRIDFKEDGEVCFELDKRKMVEAPSHSSKVSVRSLHTHHMIGPKEELDRFEYKR